LNGLKSSSARWILVVAVVCLLVGVVITLLFTVDVGGRGSSSGGVDEVSRESVVSFQVRSVKVLYSVGDVVQVEGVVVAGVSADGSVDVEVIDPGGRLWDSDTVNLSDVAENASSFSASLRSIRESDSTGVYLVQAIFSGFESNASFLVSGSSGLTAEVQGLELQDVVSGNVQRSRVGGTLLVTGSVTNLANVSSDLAFTVEMRNSSGGLVESAYVDTLIPAGSAKTLTVGWPAKDEGVYTIYAYVQDDIQSRYIVSNIATFIVTVQN
jgi:hypothetical protein